jgi:hypothetical protein
MAAPLKRTPPPPPIAVNDPIFNRWLHDLTVFISESGGIDPGMIPGYDVLVSTVNTHTTQISTLNTNVTSLTSQVGVNTSNISSLTSLTSTHTSQIAANTSNISANTSNIATLTARSQVFMGTTAPAAGTGVNGDWFSDTTAKHIYVKTGGSWVLIV